MAEIYRSGVGAVPPGQFEAARALGMSPLQVYRDIVAPQALVVIVPAAMNLYVDLLKDSALVSVVGVEDVMRAADRLSKFYFRPFEFFTAASAFYVATILLFSRVIARRVEARFQPR
jgi:polar amino acid transport system permease protein